MESATRTTGDDVLITYAALEITEQVGTRFHGDLRVGVGVNSGPVVVGTVGGGGRLDFTVIGDTVNTAARVESATRTTGDDVLITYAALEALRSRKSDWVERASLPLKGKSEVVRIFAPAADQSGRSSAGVRRADEPRGAGLDRVEG